MPFVQICEEEEEEQSAPCMYSKRDNKVIQVCLRIWIVMLHVFLGFFNMKTQQSAILIAAAATAALCISKHIIMIMTCL
jgi:hypothetical protein